MNSSLSLQALRYGHRQPLFAPLTLACRPGEIWAVLGANGRGKSTLLDTLTGVLPPLGGEMQCEGGVALVPQSFRPAFRWRVSDVVLMGRARHVDLFAQPDEEDARRVEQALAQLGIAALAEDDFGALSGGQQQLVLIARALVSASQNILLDEPCSALDLGNQQVVLQLIGDLAHRQARTVLFTTHDPNHALQVASHTLLLLALEERDARSLGVPVAALRRGVLVCCAVLVAAQVAVSGSIAWMGLVVPHLARLLVGADHRRLLPTAFWLGAALMLVVDDLARTLTQAEIPIGIVTALLGAPLFTFLLVQSRRRSTAR